MKKLLLSSASAAALVIGVPAMAQDNTSTVNQDGSSQTGTVEQSGSDNTATLNQGVDKDGNIVASSTGNNAKIDQDGTDGTATITQTGDNNGGLRNGVASTQINQASTSDNSTGEILQTGDGGQATINQAGDNSSSKVEQANGSFARVDQTDSADGARADISQDGGSSRSYASTTQSDGGSQSDIIQSGASLVADVIQSGDNTSSVTQIGSSNRASVNQTGSDNDSQIEQYGRDNEVDEPGSGGVDGNVNTPTPLAQTGVVQNGVHNISGIRQSVLGETVHTPWSTGQDATVYQSGSYNGSSIIQDGNFARADVSQVGSSNSASVNSQMYDGGSSSEYANGVIDQTGQGNVAYLSQTAAPSDSLTVQDGEGNSAGVDQTAGGADSVVRQTGYANVADVDQDVAARSNLEQGNFDPASASNRATVEQFGDADGAISDVNQNGTGNVVTIKQAGADSDSFAYQYEGGNHGTVLQSGANSVSTLIQYEGYNPQSGNLNNRATVTQNGDDTYSYLAQGGSDNEAEVTLSGTGDPNPRRTTSGEYAGSPDPATGVAAESEVWQEGTSNKATIEQIADSANARIYQGTGERYGYTVPGADDNTGTIRQYAEATDATANVFQDGSGNTAITLQSASLSSADVRQDGVGNTSDVDQQSGSNLTADVTQYADGNNSSVTQNGSDNTATVGQYSNNNESYVTQTGSGNNAAVTQGSAAGATGSF